MKEAEMIRYKAIERFFDNGENEIEHLCGFGFCRDIKEAQKTYRSGIIITEISENELKELKEEVENGRTF